MCPISQWGPWFCQALRDHGVTAPIDVHLMVQPVDALIEMFAKAGPPTSPFIPAPHITWTVLSS